MNANKSFHEPENRDVIGHIYAKDMRNPIKPMRMTENESK